MNETLKLAVGLFIALGMAAYGGGIAHADGDGDYRASMKHFLPVVESWMDEAQDLAAAAAIKPTEENLAALDALATRGIYILDDLRGTAALVPSSLSVDHWRLADAVGTIATEAEAFESDPAATAVQIASERESARAAELRIASYLSRFGAIGGAGPEEPQLGDS